MKLERMTDLKHVKRGLFLSALSGLLLTGCFGTGNGQMADENGKAVQTDGSVAYASYSEGDDTLYFVDPQTLEGRGKVQIGKGYGDSIAKDPHGRIWVPLTYKPSSSSNTQVVVFDPKARKTTKIEVGVNPTQVMFQGDTAYIFCADHVLTIYKVSADLKATKWKELPEEAHGYNVLTDGTNFYLNDTLSSDHNGQGLNQVQNIKIAPDGTVTERKVGDTSGTKVYYGLMYVNHHLYMGVTGDPTGQLAEVDPRSMAPTKTLPIHDLDGQLMQVDDQKIAAVQHIGHAAVTLYDVGAHKVLSQFELQSDIDHISLIGNNLYTVDNRLHKIALTSLTGQPIKEIDAPTMVTNFLGM
jgi:hypothetical protein